MRSDLSAVYASQTDSSPFMSRSYKKGQLLPENLSEAVKAAGLSDDQVKVNLREGYDHSYYFIQSFGPDHIAFHAKFLK